MQTLRKPAAQGSGSDRCEIFQIYFRANFLHLQADLAERFGGQTQAGSHEKTHVQVQGARVGAAGVFALLRIAGNADQLGHLGASIAQADLELMKVGGRRRGVCEHAGTELKRESDRNFAAGKLRFPRPAVGCSAGGLDSDLLSAQKALLKNRLIARPASKLATTFEALCGVDCDFLVNLNACQGSPVGCADRTAPCRKRHPVPGMSLLRGSLWGWP